jgi:hypothetical protein
MSSIPSRSDIEITQQHLRVFLTKQMRDHVPGVLLILQDEHRAANWERVDKQRSTNRRDGWMNEPEWNVLARLLEGEKMAPLCAEFGISRETGYKIFDRYKDCGLQAFSIAAIGRTDRRLGCQRRLKPRSCG